MRRIITLLLVCAVLFAAVSCKKNQGKEGKEFIIATDTTFAPFEFQNAQSEYVGVDIELLAAIAENGVFCLK
jgi:polar amino acid transport system substrate-binding protein